MKAEPFTDFDISKASPEQAAIILAEEARVLVQASAGSGKTWTVAQRYLKHVLVDGIDPSQILCVTFTNRAAVEMRDRIISAFEGIGRSELAQKAEHAVIGTVHSLCTQLLRENAVIAEVDPEFQILGEEEYSHRLRGAVHEAILAESKDKEVLAFLNTFVGKTTFFVRGPYELAIELVSTVIGFLRALPPSQLATPLFQDGNTSFFTAFSSSNNLKLAGQRLAKEMEIRLNANDLPVSDQTASLTCGCFRLAMEAWKKYENSLHHEALADYAMLERQAIELLTEKSDVRQRVSSKYKVLIVDEAQDLNPLQLELLKSISTDRSLFVGDEKQSIYRFRQAAPHLFRAMASEFKVLPLQVNRRSTRGVLESVDHVFAKTWKHYPPFLEEEEIDLEAPSVGGGVAEMRLFRTVKDSESGTRKAGENSAVARWVQTQIQSGRSAGSIAILVHTWRFASELQKVLLDFGVEARLLEGTGLLPRMETRDLANALVSLMTQSDRFALLAVLRGPLVDLSLDGIVMVASLEDPYFELETCQFEAQSDQEKLQEFLSWWKPLSKIAFRLNAFEVIDRLICEGGLLAKLARYARREEAIANIRKLLTLAAMRPEADALEFAEFLRSRERLRVGIKDADVAEDDADCVVITTIHQAKGLEWDHVILAQNTRSEPDFYPDLVIDKELPFFLVTTTGMKGKLFEELQRREVQKSNEEGQRKLYVAMTRARNQLDIYLPGQIKSGTFSEWLKPLSLIAKPQEI